MCSHMLYISSFFFRQIYGSQNNRGVSIDMSGTMENSKPKHVKEETRIQVIARTHAKSIDLYLLNTHLQVDQNIFNDFCQNSTIHGVKYFTGRKRHWIERHVILYFLMKILRQLYPLTNSSHPPGYGGC